MKEISNLQPQISNLLMTLKTDEFWKPVVTTRQILTGNDDIVCVALDDEGDWTALGVLECSDDDLDVVSVEDILLLDPSLADMPDLQQGEDAIRLSKGSPWTVEK